MSSEYPILCILYDIQLKKLGCCWIVVFRFPKNFNSAKKGTWLLHHITLNEFREIYFPSAKHIMYPKDDVTDYVLGKFSFLYPAVRSFYLIFFHNKYTPFYFHSEKRIYCGRKHPWLTCSQNAVKTAAPIRCTAAIWIYV